MDQDCVRSVRAVVVSERSIQAGTCHSMLLLFRRVLLRDVCDETIEKGVDQDPSRATVALLMDTRTLGRLNSVLLAASSRAAGMLPFSEGSEGTAPSPGARPRLTSLMAALASSSLGGRSGCPLCIHGCLERAEI